MTLAVLLHGDLIGQIDYEPANHRFQFRQTDGYFRLRPRDVLGQRFEDLRDHQVFRTSPNQLGHLPAFFANLLPERDDQEIVGPEAIARSALENLSLRGADLPGAVTVRVAESDALPSSGRVFEEPDRAAIVPEQRFSLAGVQPKLLAVREQDGRFRIPRIDEEGTWIAKFASLHFRGLPANEFATMGWARACGLDVPAHELIDVDSVGGVPEEFRALGPRVFLIERYDRTSSGVRVHQEDFAQAFGLMPSQKYGHASYEKLAQFVADLASLDDARELLCRVWFSVLCGNSDAHLKNWSLLYPDRRRARLAPAYDLVFVRPYIDRPELALALAKERDMRRLGWEHVARVERFLRKAGHDIDVVADARAFVTRARDAWAIHRLTVGPVYAKGIDDHLDAIPLSSP